MRAAPLGLHGRLLALNRCSNRIKNPFIGIARFDSSMGRAAYAARSVLSTVILIVGVLVLLFGVFLAFEAQAITIAAIVDFVIGVILIVVASWI